MTISKQRNIPSSSQTVCTWYARQGFVVRYPGLVGGSSDTIEYQDGPKYSEGRLVWKQCRHEKTVQNNQWGPEVGVNQSTGDRYSVRCPGPSRPSGSVPSIPPSLIDSVSRQVIDQFDLNCRDGVLLYSGVLQAVPLVGGAFKFVSIMNKVAKKLTRDLKRKPFTTVLKTAISLDFIDRFVVSPTIDDARKFLDAHNYVVRVMNTLSERNQAPVALTSEQTEVISRSEESVSVRNPSLDLVAFSGKDVTERSVKVKLATLAQLNYDKGAVSPIKLWAARTGITTPLDSVWDLVPFSFVVDYFTRAGDFISHLSEEMSSQDGLRGHLGGILGQWFMTTQNNVRTRKINSVSFRYGSGVILGPTEFDVRSGQQVFNRRSATFAELQSGLLAPDSGLIHWDLSTTRYRTLAELFIQAKL